MGIGRTTRSRIVSEIVNNPANVHVPDGPTQRPQLPPTGVEQFVGDEYLWYHVSLDTTTAVWLPGQGARITFPGVATKLEIFSDAGDAFWVALDADQCTTAVGTYDLRSRGGGELVKAVRPCRRIALCTASGAPPVGIVEVYALGGVAALIGG